MINIVSTAPSSSGQGGATKVYWNLVRGLMAVGYPYVVNRDLRATRRLWIHSDVFALPALSRTEAKTVLGPNLFVMPSDIPTGIRFDGALYVQPSEWVVSLWRQCGFDACEMAVWPVGIDTDRFAPRITPNSGSVLVYYKRREPAELELVLHELRRARLPHRLLRYGTYNEDAYVELLAQSSFVIWLGCPESQGIALQEAMACDVPILVWDATRLGQASREGVYVFDPSLHDFPVTSAPYFDRTCGLKVSTAREVRTALERMREELDTFRPREFVLRNLSLAGQASAFVALWKHWGLAMSDGLLERPATDAALRYRPFESLTFRWRRRFGPKLV